MNPRVEHRGANTPFVQVESTNQTRHATTDNPNNWVVRKRGGEDDLLLGEGFLENGPSGGAVRRFPPVSGGGLFGLAIHGRSISGRRGFRPGLGIGIGIGFGLGSSAC